jgi:hypothetical protein
MPNSGQRCELASDVHGKPSPGGKPHQKESPMMLESALLIASALGLTIMVLFSELP